MKIAIFSCEDAEKWRGWTERLWTGLLQTSGDIFTTFRCYEGDFPNPATCREQFDAIVVGGSHYSAYDDLPWIRQLESLLPQYVDAGVRIVGCCFGHQILAKALGGVVGKNPSGRFVLGVEDVLVDLAAARQCGLPLALPPQQQADPQGPLPQQPVQQPVDSGPEAWADSAAAAARAAAGAPSCPGAKETTGPGASPAAPAPGQCARLRMLQSHGDQVLTLPPGACLLAASGTAAHEMWALGDRCLAFQFHPELTPQLVYEKIWTALSASGRLSADETAAAEAQLKAGPGAVDSDLFAQALSGFLRAPPPQPRSVGSASPASTVAAGTAAADAEAAASGGVQVVQELRQALEVKATDAAETVLGHVRQAAAAGMAAGTANAELLTALNQQAAAAYDRAATAAEGASARLAMEVATHQDPLQAALASLGALEAQLDRLAAVVGSLELESAVLEERAEAQARDAHVRQQQQGRVQAQ